jgi:hypothetical protein
MSEIPSCSRPQQRLYRTFQTTRMQKPPVTPLRDFRSLVARLVDRKAGKHSNAGEKAG